MMPAKYPLCKYSSYTRHLFRDASTSTSYQHWYSSQLQLQFRDESEHMASCTYLSLSIFCWLVFCFMRQALYFWVHFGTCTLFVLGALYLWLPGSRGILLYIYFGLLPLVLYFCSLIVASALFLSLCSLIVVPGYGLAYLLVAYSRCHHDLRNQVVTKLLRNCVRQIVAFFSLEEWVFHVKFHCSLLQVFILYCS